MLRYCFHFTSITSSGSTVHFVVLIHSEVNSRQIYIVLWGYEMEMMMKLKQFFFFFPPFEPPGKKRELISPNSIVCVSHILSYAITELGRRGCLSSHQGRKQHEEEVKCSEGSNEISSIVRRQEIFKMSRKNERNDESSSHSDIFLFLEWEMVEFLLDWGCCWAQRLWPTSISRANCQWSVRQRGKIEGKSIWISILFSFCAPAREWKKMKKSVRRSWINEQFEIYHFWGLRRDFFRCLKIRKFLI